MRAISILSILSIACSQQLPTAPSGVTIIEPPPPIPAPYSPTAYNGPVITMKDNGQIPTKPRPTIIVLAVDGVQTLQTGQRYSDVADKLIPSGWLAISFDLPAHGSDVRPGETLPLTAWANRLAAGENIVDAFASRLSATIDGLISAQISDPKRIVVMGVSRGGFMAFHAAMRDSRIAAVVAFMPVTDLSALSEFNSLVGSPLVQSLKIEVPLPRIPYWIETPQTDPRVNADMTCDLVESMYDEGYNVYLHIEPGNTHSLPGDNVMDKAAIWISGVTM